MTEDKDFEIQKHKEYVQHQDQISKTFCHFPFTTTFIGSGGEGDPCCISEHHKVYKSDFFKNDYWNSEGLKKLRQNLLEGKKDPGCRRCWIDEAKGMQSKRLSDIDKVPSANLWKRDDSDEDFKDIEPFRKSVIVNPKMRWIDFQLANLCNLACRMCNPWNSSIIEDEAIEHISKFSDDKLKGKDLFDKHIIKPLPMVKQVKDYWKDPEFQRQIRELLPQLDCITVSGGEPTVNKYFNEILDFCRAEGIDKNLVLKFTTNGMQINRKYMEKLTGFKKVEVKVSMDGTGSVYEYIRWKGVWKTLHENRKILEEYRSDRFKVNSDPTYQVLNILNIPNLLQYHLENNMVVDNLNPVHEPPYHAISCLPKEIREVAWNKLSKWAEQNKNIISWNLSRSVNNVLKYLEADRPKEEEKYLPMFFEHTKILDEIRGQSLEKQVPELYNLIKKYDH
jgi:MoaA/NifB/PqqE/SkfB family radical SAM enzyme